jgi:hypothetical protein
VEAFWALGAPGPKKRLKRPDGELGLGGKGAENGPPGPPFSATFSQVRRLIWLPPNFKPKTKKAIATAKRLWDRYVICACRLYLRGVTERTADDVLSGIVSILVSMPIHTFWKANITTLSPGLNGSTVRPRRRRTIVFVYTGSGCAKPTASWLSMHVMGMGVHLIGIHPMGVRSTL